MCGYGGYEQSVIENDAVFYRTHNLLVQVTLISPQLQPMTRDEFLKKQKQRPNGVFGVCALKYELGFAAWCY